MLFSWLEVSVADPTVRAVECDNSLACFFTITSRVCCWMAEQACRCYYLKRNWITISHVKK